jgi:uncharacterized lipoprotein YddW (UPF0748 family)
VGREFRAAWVASVANIDWPSRAGLSTQAQQKELTDILDRAAEVGLNAVLLQVRPSCDALYESRFEPWSEYLSGRMGKAPVPYYDPLTFAVQQAHQRGLELHAWFNPFRVRHPSAVSPAVASHVSRRHPDWVRKYGDMQWLDPGNEAAREYVIQVVADLVKRYDLDGLHFDDYFYPYPIEDRKGRLIDFPDESSWKAYLAKHGKLSRHDWRRANVDSFVERLYRVIKAEKPWVKVGISPFGIWRPGNPPQIRGFDAYEGLYADARRWLREGWLDYCAPQLYWSIDQREQSFPVLLRWWEEQNVRGRHLWPGLSVARVGAKVPGSEIVEEIRLTRKGGRSTGHILWSMKSVLENRGNITAALRNSLYAQPALVPASPWLASDRPVAPRVWTEANGTVRWAAADGQSVRSWVVQYRTGATWKTLRVSPGQGRLEWKGGVPEVVAVSTVDRAANVSEPAAIQLIKTP